MTEAEIDRLLSDAPPKRRMPRGVVPRSLAAQRWAKALDPKRWTWLAPHDVQDARDVLEELEIPMSDAVPSFKEFCRSEGLCAGEFHVDTRGGYPDQGHTLQEIGDVLEVTKERIREIEAKALRKMRHPARADVLRELWED